MCMVANIKSIPRAVNAFGTMEPYVKYCTVGNDSYREPNARHMILFVLFFYTDASQVGVRQDGRCSRFRLSDPALEPSLQQPRLGLFVVVALLERLGLRTRMLAGLICTYFELHMLSGGIYSNIVPIDAHGLHEVVEQLSPVAVHLLYQDNLPRTARREAPIDWQLNRRGATHNVWQPRQLIGGLCWR